MHTTALLMAALALASLANAENPPPRALTQPLPAFPRLSVRRSARPVEVTASFVVDESGSTQQICILHSTHRQFETDVADALSRWRFQPAEANGRKVSARMTASFIFHPDRTIISEIKPR